MKICKRGHEYVPKMRMKGNGCPECAVLRARAWALSNPEQTRRRKQQWATTNREKLNRYSKAYRDLNRPRLLHLEFERREARREALRIANREYSKRNREKCRERWRRYHARKMAAVVAPVEQKHLALLLKCQDGLCRYCHAPLGNDKHLDHRTPLIRGGAHEPSNVCWSCPSCNTKKGKKSEQEFLRLIA